MKCKHCGHLLKNHRVSGMLGGLFACTNKRGKYGCECLHGEPCNEDIDVFAKSVAAALRLSIDKAFGECNGLGRVYESVMREVRSL